MPCNCSRCCKSSNLLEELCPSRVWERDYSNKMYKDIADGCCCGSQRQKAGGNVRARFGLAWITETPTCCCREPCGWQVEFIDTPSKVEQRCREMIEWVNSPPLPKNDEVAPEQHGKADERQEAKHPRRKSTHARIDDKKPSVEEKEVQCNNPSCAWRNRREDSCCLMYEEGDCCSCCCQSRRQPPPGPTCHCKADEDQEKPVKDCNCGNEAVTTSANDIELVEAGPRCPCAPAADKASLNKLSDDAVTNSPLGSQNGAAAPPPPTPEPQPQRRKSSRRRSILLG